MHLLICADLLSQQLEKALRPFELNMTQLSLLSHFSHAPERSWTISQLATVMTVNQPGLTKASKNLLDNQWLRREEDARDARIKHLFITKEGLSVLTEAKESTLPLLTEVYSSLSDEALSSMAAGINLLKTQLDEHR